MMLNTHQINKREIAMLDALQKLVHVESSNSGFVKAKSTHEHEQMNFVNISFIFFFFLSAGPSTSTHVFDPNFSTKGILALSYGQRNQNRAA